LVGVFVGDRVGVLVGIFVGGGVGNGGMVGCSVGAFVGGGAILVHTTVRLENGVTAYVDAYTSCAVPETGVVQASTEVPLFVEEHAFNVDVDEVSGYPAKRTNKSASPSDPISSHVTFSPARILESLKS
jgi:hypothetical protein